MICKSNEARLCVSPARSLYKSRKVHFFIANWACEVITVVYGPVTWNFFRQIHTVQTSRSTQRSCAQNRWTNNAYRGEYNIKKKFDCLNCNQFFWNPKTTKKFHRSILSFASSLLEFYVESQRLRLIDKGCEALLMLMTSIVGLGYQFFLCLRDSSPKAFPWRDIIWINQWVEHIYAHACAMTLSKRDNERNGEWKKKSSDIRSKELRGE